MDDIKAEFQKALKADPYDQSTRLIYADWLEEHGLDDEAQVQREWTAEKQHAAEAFLKEFAALCGETEPWPTATDDFKPHTVETVIAGAMEFLQTGEPLGIDMHWFDDEEIAEFWKHFRTVTGVPVADGKDTLFVSCCWGSD